MKLDELRAALRVGEKEEAPEATIVSHEGGGMREAVVTEAVFLQLTGKCPDCLRMMNRVDRNVYEATETFRCSNCGVVCTVSSADIENLWY